jgi:hypothetical protein
MMIRLALAVSFSLTLSGVAFANTIQLASQVSGLNVAELSELPHRQTKAQKDTRWQCALRDEEINTAAGKLVSAHNWWVTGEVERAGFTFVSFVASSEPTTSASCIYSDGNVGIFRGEELLGVIYADKAAERAVGDIGALEGDRLRIYDGSDLNMPLADLEIVGHDLVIVRNVSNRDSFCGGAISAPNIFGLSIPIARQVLFAEGWEAGPVPIDDDTDAFGHAARKQFPELDTCSGTGFGFCAYVYSKEEGQIMRVISAGGEPDEMANHVIRFSAYCEADI